jgi:hypothetical protein
MRWVDFRSAFDLAQALRISYFLSRRRELPSTFCSRHFIDYLLCLPTTDFKHFFSSFATHFLLPPSASIEIANMKLRSKRPMKKGAGTSAGLPRASGERHSPVAGAHNQVSHLVAHSQPHTSSLDLRGRQCRCQWHLSWPQISPACA